MIRKIFYLFVLGLLLVPGLARAAAKVPFTSQAPGGQWKEPRFQDGCEEASVLMAMSWAQKKEQIADPAKELLAMADWELKRYGTYQDTSAADTLARLVNTYYGYQQASLVPNAKLNDTIKAVSSGYVVLVPTDGRLLKNPNYTQPGPSTHMLVLIGYDAQAKQFITNDSGTRRGAGYRYPQATLYNAVADYPTGHHLPRRAIIKDMIVIWRNGQQPYDQTQKK